MNANDWQRLEAEALALIHVAAPELRKQPLYFCNLEKLTGDTRPSRIAVAFVGGPVDHQIARPHVANYRGRGPVIFYSPASVEIDAGRPEDVQDVFLEVMLHEVGHVLELQDLDAAPAKIESDPVYVALCRREILRVAAAEPAPSCEAKYRNDLHLRFHNARFIRACCHLKSRVETRLGKLFPMVQILRKDYPPRGEYFLHALNDEPERCAHWPIAEILKLPVPPEFAGLWERNVAAFHALEAEREAARVLRETNHQRQLVISLPDGAFPPPANAGDAKRKEFDMSLNTFLENVGLRRRQKKQTAIERYKQLVCNVADGKLPDAAVAEEILDAAGETEETLRAGVKGAEDRRKDGQLVNSAAGVAVARQKIAADQREADAKLERAQQEHETRTGKNAIDERAIDDVARAAADAKARLENSASDEKKVALKSAEQLRGKIGQQLWDAEHQLAAALGTRASFGPVVEMASPAYEGKIIGGADNWQRENFPSLEKYSEARQKVRQADVDISRLTAAVSKLKASIPAADAAVDAARLALLTD